MTAYLKPGDRIHLAIPSPTNGYGRFDQSKVDQDVRSYKMEFEAWGVKVESWTICSNLPGPVVVAVLRDE